jgi:bacterioferritin
MFPKGQAYAWTKGFALLLLLFGPLALSARRRMSAPLTASPSPDRSVSGSGAPGTSAPASLTSPNMKGKSMSETKTATLNREQLIALLNEDLAREYQAIIAYVNYSQVLKGAQYMNIAQELEVHAAQELAHALTIAKQIDYLGGMPTVTPLPVKTSEKATDMLRFDLDNENETVANYRVRVRQCEAMGEYAIAENIRQILMQEQEHQIDLATALGVEVPDVTRPEQRA